MGEEAASYHALASVTRGNYDRLAKLMQSHGSWKASREYMNAPVTTLPPDISLILKEEASYPPRLREISRSPHALYVRGALPPSELAIGIVGTRRATPDGIRTARLFGTKLAERGACIVSGLAFGIDAAAHEGALDAKGAAIAVLAGGLRNIHPRSNERLAERIVALGGALVSEYPPEEPPRKERFLERNRIISGLSRGVVIIEAPARSGSLATARFASEQNRELFVVPGNIRHPNFKGSHALIRQGAELVTDPNDVIAAYGIEIEASALGAQRGASPEETLILEALRVAGGTADIDKLVAMTRLEPRVATTTLSLLFIKELVREAETGYTIN